MGSTNCDKDAEGAAGMMACYKFEEADKKYGSPTIDFDTYEKFRAAVPGLMSFNNYAWKMSGNRRTFELPY